MMHVMDLMIHLHIGPSNSDQLSVWLLGATAGFVLAVAANRLIRLNAE